MTDTDAGKRLSDAELAQIAERHKLENVKGSNLWSNWYECNAQREKLLSHIAAITANRGSVSEDILAREIYSVREKIHGHYPDSGPFDELPAMQKDWLLREARGLLQIFTIQQAVSECSGGGAEEMREKAAIEAESYEYPQHTSSSEHLIMGRVSADIAKQIRALPLPPSPVKESRDA